VNEFITLLQGIKHFPISDSEKKVLYNIINNRQRNSNEKIRKLKNFFGFKNNNKVENHSTTSVEVDSLMEKGILKLNNTILDSNPRIGLNQQRTNEKCKLTSAGLIHIFSNRYTYSPDFLIKYNEDIVLQELLFKHIQSNTIKSATAKFFNIITDYLTASSDYIINLELEPDKPLTAEVREEIVHNIKIFSLILGFKITILFNEYNIIPSGIGANNDNVIFAIHQVESLMKKNLAKDPKFLNLLSIVSSEFNSGHDDFVSLMDLDGKHKST
jgi:hypothetical protein